MRRLILPLSLILLIGCEPASERRQRERKAIEQSRQNQIDSELGSHKGALNFEEVSWGGPFTFSRQEFIRKNPNQLFYIETWRVDAAYVGDQMIITFKGLGFSGDTIFRLVCSRPQLSPLEGISSEDTFQNYIIVFSIKDFVLPVLTVDSEVTDADENGATSSAVFTEAEATIAIGQLIKIGILP